MPKAIYLLLSVFFILMGIIFFMFFYTEQTEQTEQTEVVPSKETLQLEDAKELPPEGYTIDYNVVTKKYRWCFPNSLYCPTHTLYNGKVEAIKAAWGQFNFQKRMKETPKAINPNEEEANWRKVIMDKVEAKVKGSN